MENTEILAGNRERLKSELRWLYFRCMKLLDLQTSATLSRTFATSGLHFVRIMDRYHERLEGTHFSFSTYSRCKLGSYSILGGLPSLGLGLLAAALKVVC